MSRSQTGFERSEHIRHRREFERAYEHGIRVSGRFMLLFVIANDGPVSRLGVAATRKLGSSVERNRAKRLARELFRRRKLRDALDIIIVPRRDMLDAPFASLEADYHATLERRAHARPAGRPVGRRRDGARGSARL
jgi:ribonuclease P protein component